jgi:hypothetical protein
VDENKKPAVVEKKHPELDYGAYAPNLMEDSPMSNFFAMNHKGQLKDADQQARCARQVRQFRGLQKQD